jgi:hypothetical protein
MGYTKKLKVPKKYIPAGLTTEDKKKQKKELIKSRNNYKKGIYKTRKRINSFKGKKSNHVKNAFKIYNIESMNVNKELSKKTGCSIPALNKILNKGRGAYYSSGSRPNQTADSWGYARLASSITGGKSSAIDYSILKDGCSNNSKALKLANKSKKKYSKGKRKVGKIHI